MSPDSWIVTTTKGRDPTCETRAEEVARRCGLRFVERRDSLARLLRRHEAEGAYVIGPGKAELRAQGLKLSVHPSMLHHVRHVGRGHPLLRSVAPEGEDVERVVDATLGLAKDALHIATFLECRVTGLEGSSILACLCEDGLARLEPYWRAGAERIEVVHTESLSWLAEQDPDSADVVLLDPMFEEPVRAAAGFDLLRGLALHLASTAELVEAAARVAKRRVVLKLPRGAQPPSGLGNWIRTRGQSLDYFANSLTCS
jgi:16S rRNA (guanine1516-N2)-methyltransferase